MKILVTGSKGSVGMKLAAELLRKGHDVFGVDQAYGFGPRYQSLDVSQESDLLGVFESFRPELTIHLAACVTRTISAQSPAGAFESNASGTRSVASLCVRFKSRLIYFSTSEIYGNAPSNREDEPQILPCNWYGLTKWMGEEIVRYHARENGLTSLVIRPFMLYSEDDFPESTPDNTARSALIIFMDRLSKGLPVQVHAGTRRGWLHKDDLIAALVSAVDFKKSGVVNIGHPDVISLKELATRICRLYARDASTLVTEVPLPSGTTLSKTPTLERQRILLGFDPRISLDEGMSRLMRRFPRQG